MQEIASFPFMLSAAYENSLFNILIIIAAVSFFVCCSGAVCSHGYHLLIAQLNPRVDDSRAVA